MTDVRRASQAPGPDLSGATWRKSTYSGGNGSCVEVATLGRSIAVRDSHDKNGPKLIVTADDWRLLLRQVKARANLQFPG
jgi:Domain of unknown function (DUF397)